MSRTYEILRNGKTLIKSGDVHQFRITFNALIDFGAAISYLDLSVYNLSETTSNILGKVAKTGEKEETIHLVAGYDDKADLIFAGRVRQRFSDRKGASTITRILAVGGTFFDTRISKTFGKNTKLSAIIEYIVLQLGFAIDYDAADFQMVYPSGYMMDGMAKGYMDKLARAHGFQYATENSRIVITKNGKKRKGETLIVSQFTGLEGIPEITQIGINAKMRLNPKAKVGGIIQVDSKYRSFNFGNMYFNEIPEAAGMGQYKIVKIAHSGDSHGTEWATTVDGLKL